MKKILLFSFCLFGMYVFAQDVDIAQTDWTGGPGQTTFEDVTKFNISSFVDYTSNPGDIGLMDNTNNSFYGVAPYQDKIMVGTGYGNFIYNPQDSSWKHSYSGTFVVYKTTTHNEVLYNLHGYNIYTYDGTENDYGFGENGWKFHSSLKPLGITSTYTIKSIDNELYVGARSGYSGKVLKWNASSSSWIQIGQSFSNGVITLEKYNGVIYAGTHWSGQIYKLAGNSWTYIKSAGVMTVNKLHVFNNKLYAAGWSTSYASGRILSFDGTNWTTIYSGYGINDITSDSQNLYFSARTSTSGRASKILKYNGSSVNILYSLPSELYVFNLTSFNDNLYYGGLGATTTSNFYKNGQVLEKINGGYLFSSDINNSGSNWGSLIFDASISNRSGISIILEGKKDDGTYGFRISHKNNSSIQITENTMRYGVYFWSFLNAELPSLQQIGMPSENVDTTPPIMISKDITISIETNGEASITPEAIDNGSSDDSGVFTLSLDKTTFNCANLGENTITLTGVDENGNTASTLALVTVVDDIAPTVFAKDFAIELDTNGIASITAEQIDDNSYDNCGIANISVKPNIFSCDDLGEQLVTLTVTDNSGNVSTKSSVVIVTGEIPAVSIADFESVSTQKSNTIFKGYGSQSATLFTSATGGSDFTYSWTSSTGEIIDNIANPEINPQISTVYTVTVTNLNGCSATASIDVCVVDARSFDKNGKVKKGKVRICHFTNSAKNKFVIIDIATNAVAGHLRNHGDTLGSYEAVCITEGTDATVNVQSVKNEVVVYPNPIKNKVNISLNTGTKVSGTIQVYELSGRMVYTKKVKDLEKGISINTSKLKRGTYVVRIICEDSMYTRLFIKI